MTKREQMRIAKREQREQALIAKNELFRRIIESKVKLLEAIYKGNKETAIELFCFLVDNNCMTADTTKEDAAKMIEQAMQNARKRKNVFE